MKNINIDLKTYIEKHTDFTVEKIDDTFNSFVSITLERYYLSYSNKESVIITFSFITMSLNTVSSNYVTFHNLKVFNSLLKKYYKNKIKVGE